MIYRLLTAFAIVFLISCASPEQDKNLNDIEEVEETVNPEENVDEVSENEAVQNSNKKEGKKGFEVSDKKRDEEEKKVVDMDAAVGLGFINNKNGLDIGNDVQFNLATYAAEDVAIVREGSCSEECGKMVYALNYNDSEGISIVVEINWKAEDGKMELLRYYELKPEEQIHLGCSEDCQNDFNVKWKIVSAEYM